MRTLGAAAGETVYGWTGCPTFGFLTRAGCTAALAGTAVWLA
jgi:hypothetical protein